MKISSLLPTEPVIVYQSNYKSFDKDEHFIKTNKMLKQLTRTPSKLLPRGPRLPYLCGYFAEKSPGEIGNLMIYAHTVQKIVESSADQAALRYDNEFRRWRQRDPFGFPWQHNNVELHQEAVVLGLCRQCFPPHSRLLTVCGKKLPQTMPQI